MRKSAILFGLPATALLAGLSGSYVLPLDHPAIRYETEPLHDPIVTRPRESDLQAAKKTSIRVSERLGKKRGKLEPM